MGGNVRVGVIGCGYWGPNLIRNFASADGCELAAIADPNADRLMQISRLHPSARAYPDAGGLIRDTNIDAVAIATPVRTHFELAAEALDRGKHVLVEKPMAASSAQARQLIAMARAAQRTLMVDHTFIYTGAVRKIRELIDSGALGEIFYFDSVRANLGLFQSDANVLWDLAPHDLSILIYLFDQEPESVSAVGAAPVGDSEWRPESVMYIAIRLRKGPLAHFHVNWLSPVKIRRALVGGSRKMIIYDHLDPDFQVKIFDKGVDVATGGELLSARVEYRAGDMTAPKVDQTEGLAVMASHFIESVRTGSKPLSDGRAGLKVVELLEAAQRSMDDQEGAGELARVSAGVDIA